MKNPSVATTSAPQRRGAELADLVEDYLASCRARGLARGTVEQAYGYTLKTVFLPWCAKNGVLRGFDLDQRTFDRFTSDLLEMGGKRGQLSRHTVHSYVRAVRQLASWAEREEEMGPARPQLPRLPRRVIDTLSREEIDRLEKAAGTERNALIIRVMADTGIRATELCSLRRGDVIRQHNRTLLRIHGKGDKERFVPITPPLARRLSRYADASALDSDFLFTSSRCNAYGEYTPLTRSGLLQIIYGVADRAGIPKHVHPHLLRHSFATEALRRGMNTVQLADILGHSGLRMIESTYAHLTVTDAYDAVMKMLTTRD